MTSLHADLRLILDAVEIHSPTRYAILGEVRDLPPAVPDFDPDPAGHGPVTALSADLYDRLYTRPCPSQVRPTDRLAGRDLLAALSEANSGRGTWEPGWTVLRVEADGRVAVARDGLTFWVSPKGLRADGGGEARAGGHCRVRVPKELRNLQPGFYIAIGDGEGDEDDQGDDVEPLLRYYWHLTSGAAVPFIAATARLLNAARIPFRAKVLSDPAGYRRADAGVLYLRRRYYERLGDTLARVHRDVAPGLRPDPPLFSKRLGPGVGLAEDPAGEMSFGQDRCRRVARALWLSFARGDSDRAESIRAEFRQAGLDPSRPHLGPHSRDDYELQPPPVGGPFRAAREVTRPPAARTP